MRWLLFGFVLFFLGGYVFTVSGQNGQAESESESGIEETIGREENWKLERGSKELSLEFGYAPMQPTFLSGREEYDT
ncbi:MAG TPA: hypothetical protein VFZ23_06355, partial [Pyrinomonadaceae bacterium]